ncbi:MAG: lytic murein transglycosylase B [Acidobacteriota bacterium]
MPGAKRRRYAELDGRQEGKLARKSSKSHPPLCLVPPAGSVLSLAILLTLTVGSSYGRGLGSWARHPELLSFIEDMAERHGFDRAELKGVFSKTRFQPRIVKIMSRPKDARTWEAYRPMFVNSERIQGGLGFMKRNAHALKRASERFGVPEEMVTAIIGVETHYGKQTGRYKVLDALVTLAFDYPLRAGLFRRELEHYLLLTREEGIRPLSLKGSFAGAMGIAQFMPGSYRHYGVDFDGDGKRDLVRSVVDAIGSVANYLTAHGWESRQPVAVRARVAGEGGQALPGAGLESWYSLEELRRHGVTPAEDVPGNRHAMLVALQTEDGPEYWLGLRNFHVLTRYNHSVHYAMSVYQLSREIRALRRQASGMP